MKSQTVSTKLTNCTSPTQSGRKPKSTTDEDKHQRRLASNRKSAFKSRYRKKVIIEELQKKKQHLLVQIETVRRQNLLINQIISELKGVTKVPEKIIQSDLVTSIESEKTRTSSVVSPTLSSRRLIPNDFIQHICPSTPYLNLANFVIS